MGLGSEFEQGNVLHMMGLWEHVHRLYDRNVVFLLKEGKVARLCGRIAADIDDARYFKFEQSLHHFRVHTVTRGIRH